MNEKQANFTIVYRAFIPYLMRAHLIIWYKNNNTSFGLSFLFGYIFFSLAFVAITVAGIVLFFIIISIWLCQHSTHSIANGRKYWIENPFVK